MTVPVLGGFPGCCSPAATGEPQRETQEQGGERQRDPCVTVCLQVNQHRCLRGSSREKRDGLLTWLFRRLARAQQKHVGRTLRVSGCSHKTSERVQTEMPRRKFEAKFKLPGGSQGEGCCEFRLRWFITARSVLPAVCPLLEPLDHLALQQEGVSLRRVSKLASSHSPGWFFYSRVKWAETTYDSSCRNFQNKCNNKDDFKYPVFHNFSFVYFNL